jgi:DNA adenine methylase
MLGDFERLLQLLTTLKGRFMLSSYPSDILSYTREQGWKTLMFELSRSAGRGRKIEVLTMNYDSDEACRQVAA